MSYKGQNDGKIWQENYTVRVWLCKISALPWQFPMDKNL